MGEGKVHPLGTNQEDHRSLRILDALSTVLVRKHKVIAVMVKPYDGSDVQFLASMVQPSNESLYSSLVQILILRVS